MPLNRRAVAVLVLVALGACSPGTGAGPGGPGAKGIEDEGSGSTLATGPAFQLLGKVVDQEGLPVPEAIITAGDSVAMSAPDGWFDLALAATGSISVGKPGWLGSEVEWDGSSGFIEVPIEPRRLRGLRVAADVAGDDAEFAAILDLAEATAVNTLVFDTKQEGGRVLYDTSVTAAHESGAVVNAYDPVERIRQAHEQGLYAITRIVTFEDWYWAEARPEEAYEGGWINPTVTAGWEYPLALAEEACSLGFDEIQFDYVRFPSESTAKASGQLDMTQAERVTVIEGFLREARLRLHDMGCAISADVFGIVVSARDDQGIGQRPEELSRQLDAFSPMVYPSHYSDGWLGLDEPNDHPYDVTSDAIDDALDRIEPGVILRPWLQAFWWTNEQIRRSIQAAEDHEVGWFLWNAVSNFSRSAIPTDAEVEG